MVSFKTQLWNGFLQNSALEGFTSKLSFRMFHTKTQLWNGFLQNSVSGQNVRNIYKSLYGIGKIQYGIFLFMRD